MPPKTSVRHSQPPIPAASPAKSGKPADWPFSPAPPCSPPPHPKKAAKRTWKLREDSWISNPPQVKSYLVYSTASCSGLIAENDTFAAVSPNCGFGWRFRFNETFHYLKSDSNPRVQELVGRVDLTLEPNLCSSMPLSEVKVNVKVSYPSDNAKTTQEGRCTDISFQTETRIGTYTEPSGYEGEMHVEVTLVFSGSDGLSLPTTSSTSTRKALRSSLDRPSFVDTKFYLFSCRVQGRPARPKALFANSVLMDTSIYLQDLLSPASGFASGTPCDLYEATAKEIAKLDVNAYDYDSDSDLEDEGEDDDGKDDGGEDNEVKDGSSTEILPPKIEKGSEPDEQLGGSAAARTRVGKAFAINGTAYKTWRAFLYYCYTKDIHFNALRSLSNPTSFANAAPEDPDTIRCSPKSMYRFADYANLPELMTLAKEAIQENLSESNIVTELFSNFTLKYPEIIDLEIRYLVDNFTYGVANDFDEMLEKIVAGSMPHCGQVLKLSIKELRTADSQVTKFGAFGGRGRKGPALQTPKSALKASHPPTNAYYFDEPGPEE